MEQSHKVVGRLAQAGQDPAGVEQRLVAVAAKDRGAAVGVVALDPVGVEAVAGGAGDVDADHRAPAPKLRARREAAFRLSSGGSGWHLG